MSATPVLWADLGNTPLTEDGCVVASTRDFSLWPLRLGERVRLDTYEEYWCYGRIERLTEQIAYVRPEGDGDE